MFEKAPSPHTWVTSLAAWVSHCPHAEQRYISPKLLAVADAAALRETMQVFASHQGFLQADLSSLGGRQYECVYYQSSKDGATDEHY